MAMEEKRAKPLGAQQLQDECHDDDRDAEEEREHFQQVCRSYQQYATFHQTRQQGVIHRMHRMLSSSPQSDGDAGPTVESILPPSLLPQETENQQRQKKFCDATIRNQFFLDSVLKYSGVMTSQEVLRQRRDDYGGGTQIEWATEDQMSKITSVLKSVARDWSAEGREERSVAYDRLVGALERYMPLTSSDSECVESMDGSADGRLPPRVAVPGSGLGRLAWEIYSKGYSTQGSDFSLPMLLASDFVLNGCGIPTTDADAGGESAALRQFSIIPWISETKNTTSFANRTRAVVVPDVNPTSLPHHGGDGAIVPEFTMMAGEFLSLYSRFLPDRKKSQNSNCRQRPEPPEENFHAVVCSFFLDTAPSLPHYLLTIYHMLKDGGLLLHFGPLMYHWSGHGSLLPVDRDAFATHSNDDDHNRWVGSIHEIRNRHLDQRYLTSIDYTWEEFRHMVLQCGFEIVEEEMYIPARYTADSKSMMKTVYDCSFLVARKKVNR